LTYLTAIGSGFGHFANIFLSVVIAGSIADADECQWYCLTYMIDSTVGTVINILLLKCFEGQVQRFLPDCTLMRFGDYGDPPQLCIWFPQLVVWMCIVIVAKLITLYLLLQFIQPLNFLVSHLFSVFHDKPQVELVLVMIIIPTIMNTIQFWVTDTFLKKHEEEEQTDSELDEELISGVSLGVDQYMVVVLCQSYAVVVCCMQGGNDPDSLRYSYRAAAPMRGSTMQRTHSGHSGSAAHVKTRSGGAYKGDSSDASEGIQLSSLANGGGGGGSYATLSSSSAHGEADEEGNSSPVYASSRKVLGQGPRSPSRSNSSIVPGVLNGIAAFFPSSLTGISTVKLERAGSDERLESIGNPITGNSNRGSDYDGASSGSKYAPGDGGVGVGSLRGDAGGSAVKSGSGVAKGYYTPGTHSTVKQRTTSSAGSSAAAHGASNSSIGASMAGGGSGAGAAGRASAAGGGGAIRSGSLDSAEEKDMYL
jgi:hypothetical protein